VDRGPDNSWKGSLTNIIQYGYLWFSQHLQVLIVHGYSPDTSAFNPIERIFSSATTDVTGLTFSDRLEGEIITVASPLSAIRQLNDLRVAELTKFFHGKKHDGFPVISQAISALDCGIVTSMIDHDEWHDYVMGKGPKTDLEKNEFICFLMDHLDKRKDLLCFSTCLDETCKHCRLCKNTSPRFMEHFRNTFRSKIPHPFKRGNADEHFLTYLEIEQIRKDAGVIPDLTRSPDGLQQWTYCKLGRHQYFFDSDADLKRHFAICHPGIRVPTEYQLTKKTNKLYIENKRYYLNGMELSLNARVEALYDDGNWYPGYVSGFQAKRIRITFDDGDFHAYSNNIRWEQQ
jgi:hypothetical protein